MKQYLFLSLCLILLMMSCKSTPQAKTQIDKPIYDSLLAQSYGADDYGMKKYILAFLKKGSNTDLSREKREELQIGHMKNIGLMAKNQQLVVAGPFMNNDTLRGLYIFNTSSLKFADSLCQTDPAINIGLFNIDLVEWYGSAALMGMNDTHAKLVKKPIVSE